MNWLNDVSNMILGEPGKEVPAVSAPAKPGQEADSITVIATGASSDGSSADEDTERVAASAEEELEQLQHLNLGGLDSRDGVLDEVRKVLFQPSKLSKYMGMDVTSLMSVPLFIMEPFSMLQKMAEIMEYTHLLDAANAEEDPYERIALVAAFLVTPFGAAERTWKPFNPVLGETFEADKLQNDAFFVAEQVSHHPPVSAAHAENSNWTYDIVSAPTTKFLGNSLEVYPKGRTRISLRRTGELYSHVPPSAKVHNLVLGKTWIDSFGSFHVRNINTGVRVEMEFKPCGWFGSGQYEFEGLVLDEQGNAHGILSGKWNSHVDLTPSKPDGSPADGASARRLWSCAPKPAEDAYGCTHFAWKLANTDLLRTPPLASDSRRRGDRHALQERHMVIAAAEKGLIEDEQRVERKKREQQGDQWSPKFFAPAHDMEVLPGEETPEAVPLWAWNGKYSEAKQQPEVQEWEGTVCGQGFMPWQYRSTPLERKAGSSSKSSSRNSSRSPERGSKKEKKSPSKSKS